MDICVKLLILLGVVALVIQSLGLALVVLGMWIAMITIYVSDKYPDMPDTYNF